MDNTNNQSSVPQDPGVQTVSSAVSPEPVNPASDIQSQVPGSTIDLGGLSQPNVQQPTPQVQVPLTASKEDVIIEGIKRIEDKLSAIAAKVGV